jgi:vacuolar-type H+-ATPase subunit I/STV1
MAGEEPDDALAGLGALCEDISAGRYDRVDALMAMTGDEGLPDAVRRLAEAFGMMIVKVEAREFRLSGLVAELEVAKRQLEAANARLSVDNRALADEVDRLKIRVDVLSRDREVSEIAETDYFRALQARAGALRDRYR